MPKKKGGGPAKLDQRKVNIKYNFPSGTREKAIGNRKRTLEVSPGKSPKRVVKVKSKTGWYTGGGF